MSWLLKEYFLGHHKFIVVQSWDSLLNAILNSEHGTATIIMYPCQISLTSPFLRMLKHNCTAVSGEINPDWDCLQTNDISISSKIDNLMCSL
jgi:hypothetical protein